MSILHRLASPLSFLLLILLFVLQFGGCQGNPQPEHRITSKSIDEVLQENRPHLMTIQGVVGTSIGDCNGNPCIKVLVDKKTPIIQQQIPSMLETWQVEIVEKAP